MKRDSEKHSITSYPSILYSFKFMSFVILDSEHASMNGLIVVHMISILSKFANRLRAFKYSNSCLHSPFDFIDGFVVDVTMDFAPDTAFAFVVDVDDAVAAVVVFVLPLVDDMLLPFENFENFD